MLVRCSIRHVQQLPALETAVAHESTPQSFMTSTVQCFNNTVGTTIKSNLKNILENIMLFRFYDFYSILGNVVKLVDTTNPLKTAARSAKKVKT